MKRNSVEMIQWTSAEQQQQQQHHHHQQQKEQHKIVYWKQIPEVNFPAHIDYCRCDPYANT